MSSIAWVIPFGVVSYWKLKVGVALYLDNPSPCSSADKKGIDSPAAWPIPTIRPPRCTYLLVIYIRYAYFFSLMLVKRCIELYISILEVLLKDVWCIIVDYY